MENDEINVMFAFGTTAYEKIKAYEPAKIAMENGETHDLPVNFFCASREETLKHVTGIVNRFFDYHEEMTRPVSAAATE